jgi:hypothetical protein
MILNSGSSSAMSFGAIVTTPLMGRLSRLASNQAPRDPEMEIEPPAESGSDSTGINEK